MDLQAPLYLQRAAGAGAVLPNAGRAKTGNRFPGDYDTIPASGGTDKGRLYTTAKKQTQLALWVVATVTLRAIP
jgi:hypothetical protein